MLGIFLTQSLPVASEIRFLTKYEAHRFGYAGWPASSRDPLIMFPQHWDYRHALPCLALDMSAVDLNSGLLANC